MNCEICNKNLDKCQKCKAFNMILCSKHYQQILKFGHHLDNNPRTQKDLNEYIIHEENQTVEIFLYNSKGYKFSSFIIDVDDLERTIVKKWRYWKGRVFTGNFKPINISHFILEIDDIECNVVDHINSNPLDNRKSNLRVTIQNNNAINKSLQKNNSSEFSGVWFDNKRNKYCAEIKYKNIKCFLGRHQRKCDAVYVRYIAEINLFKEYRSSNNDEEISLEIKKCTKKEELYEYVKKRIFDRYNLNIR